MPFNALPIEDLPYKRWAALTPSDVTVYDPPPDALWIPASSGDLYLVGSDSTSVVFHFGSVSSGDPHGIYPLAPTKVAAASTITPIGLWRE